MDVAVETDEQAEFSGVLDFAFDHAANRVTVSKAVPRIGLCLLEAQRNAALVFVHFQHHDVDFLAGGHDLARIARSARGSARNWPIEAKPRSLRSDERR